MAYTAAPLTDTIVPYNRVAYTETVVRNLLSSEIFCGFIGAHGRRLKANGDSAKGDFYTMLGSLEGALAASPGFVRRHGRLRTHYLNTLANNIVRVTENHRVVITVPCSNTLTVNITKGDLVWWDGPNKVKSAAAFPWRSNLATTQGDFVSSFLGVAMSSKVSGDGVTSLNVDISPNSFFDFTTSTAIAKTIGTIMAPAQGTGNTLSATVLATVVEPTTKAIARCVRHDATAVATAYVQIASGYYGLTYENAPGPQFVI